MRLIEATISAGKLDDVTAALAEIGIQGFTASAVREYGAAKGCSVWYRDTLYTLEYSPKLKMEIVVADNEIARVVSALELLAASGGIGDDILLLPCEENVHIRTGEISVAVL
jgi:nitrogen regulatory protein P-II 1